MPEKEETERREGCLVQVLLWEKPDIERTEKFNFLLDIDVTESGMINLPSSFRACLKIYSREQ